MASKEKRSNIWAFVVYPGESLPNNYLNIINNWHIPALISPIHSKDLNGDNTEKKKHIHIMLYFGVGANKSKLQVEEYTKQLNGTFPIIVNNTNAMIRYFIHLDNPEKHQYNKEELVCLNGFEIGNAFDSFTNDSLMYNHLEEIIYDNMIYNYALLIKILRDHNLKSELDFIRRHSQHINYILNGYFQLITNNRQKQLEEKQRKDYFNL